MNSKFEIRNSKLSKGFTLMELIISTALLGIIMAAVSTLFYVGIRNYQRESQRNLMQKELNFTADDLGAQIKQAADSPTSFDSYLRDPQTAILALPAINEDEDFLYQGSGLLYDHIIYSLRDGALYKTVVPEPTSARAAKEDLILSNVTQFNCSYNPPAETQIITCTIGTSKAVFGKTLDFQATKTARMRNHR